MESAVTAVDTSLHAESSTSAVSWGPILAGALAASSITFLLMLLGSGLGLTMVSPWSGSGASVTTFAVSTAIWLVVVQWLSSGLGGYLTGRLRTRWTSIHDDEVYFRDTAHGFMAWSVGTLIVVGVLNSALTATVATGTDAAATVASGAAMGTAAGVSSSADAEAADNATAYMTDTLFRPADPSAFASTGAGGDVDAAAQASRILIASAAGTMSDEDEAYLAQLVSARTGLSEADAEARVDAVLARVEDAKVQAKEAADTARKAGATFALLAALSLVIGAFIASVAAVIGGRQRDEDQVKYLATIRR